MIIISQSDHECCTVLMITFSDARTKCPGVFKMVRHIIESVDSISRDGPDTPIYVIHHKKPNISEQILFLEHIYYLPSLRMFMKTLMHVYARHMKKNANCQSSFRLYFSTDN